MEEDSKIVFLAIGSIGDVLPLCRVAKDVCLRDQCAFITHLEHKASFTLTVPLRAAQHRSVTLVRRPCLSCLTHLKVSNMQKWLSPFVEGSGLTLHYVSTPPARVWNAQTDTQPLRSGASEGTEDVRLEEHLQACITALAIPGEHSLHEDTLAPPAQLITQEYSNGAVPPNANH